MARSRSSSRTRRPMAAAWSANTSVPRGSLWRMVPSRSKNMALSMEVLRGSDERTLSPDLVHYPVHRDDALGQAMTPRLEPDAVKDEPAQVLQRGSEAQRRQQVNLVLAQQAQAEAPIGGQPGAGARGAERGGDRT